MKRFYFLVFSIVLISSNQIITQVIDNQKYDTSFPILIKPVNHDPDFKNFPENSFYESRNDWRHIIDSVWGPGLPLSDKLNIFNTFANTLHDQFDGFISLGINWDSLRIYYQEKINDSTSRGAFSAVLSDLTLNLRDYHTQAYDVGVRNTPLNPGVPLLALSGFLTVEHFGAVVTVLPDDKICVIRAVNNHPLSLEPGDIILGYEGIPWSYLVNELQEYVLPSFGSLGGALSVNNHQKLICVGMNWHLFDTIDILKYSTGDTVHLPTSLLAGLSTTQMLNNEQVTIPGISFPNYFNNQFVSYGILNNTNIGYIYLYQEQPQALVEQQFYEAVAALQNTDGLIIDMRINFGGWAFFAQAFEILFNDSHLTIEDAHRCNINTFEMCPAGNASWYQITNTTPDYYDRPIAVLLGPTCVSMGDLTAQRFRYHPMVRFFGEAPAASLGDNTGINNWPAFTLHYSFGDMFHVSEPGSFLNRVEFPIDYPVWHNAYDIANGKDAVVERALAWMDSLVFPHNITVEKYFYSAGDSVHLFTTIENPNSHQLSARAYLKTLNGVIIDSVDLYKQSLNFAGENWRADFTLPPPEEFYRVALTIFDETEADHFSVPNTAKVTTIGPVTIDSIYVQDQSTYFFIKPFVKNNSTVTTITNASMHLICNDPWVISILPETRELPDMPPGSLIAPSTMFRVDVDTSIFPDYFNFKVDVSSTGWPYWIDSMRVPPIAIISINPTELNFGEVAIDSSETKTFTITNYGDEDLVIYNITSSNPVFTVNITSSVVLPDSSQEVEVTFTPTGAISFNGKIEITHNAAGSPDSVLVFGEGVIVGVEDELKPLTYNLDQNYPNPFNPETTIGYGIKEKSNVKITVINSIGEEVAILVNEEKEAGYHTIEFDAANLPSGVYFYQLKAGEYVNTKKMILLK